ncbi:hypothetical protein [Mesorhizobium sp.]|uniref:hypothetical protein n=1 Tax=Mesorhizobium sp. TaxID=1871066 RepID=UPI0011F51828|nr:hypothetical protein [Mesorhizobium sp.]TIL38510.1 MAG: hypothetical protein E5Y82_13480 [Mesorhizobium sp.]
MSGTELMAVVGFFILLFGFIFGLWKYVDAKLMGVKQDAAVVASAAQATASLAREELGAHKLHVAEHYVTKAGLAEQTTQIMKAIDGVADRLDGVNQRLDRVFEQPKTARRAT